jgi:hypothetical protein
VTILTIHGRELDIDVEATRAAYLEVAQGGSESCTCLHCANYAAMRSNFFPPALRDLLAKLGIDWQKESEVYSLTGKVDEGMCAYAGWFHALATMRPFDAEDVQFELEPGLHILIGSYMSSPTVLKESQKDLSHHMVEVHFSTKVPWVLTETPN